MLLQEICFINRDFKVFVFFSYDQFFFLDWLNFFDLLIKLNGVAVFIFLCSVFMFKLEIFFLFVDRSFTYPPFHFLWQFLFIINIIGMSRAKTITVDFFTIYFNIFLWVCNNWLIMVIK